MTGIGLPPLTTGFAAKKGFSAAVLLWANAVKSSTQARWYMPP